jgi:hypothetical protein
MSEEEISSKSDVRTSIEKSLSGRRHFVLEELEKL